MQAAIAARRSTSFCAATTSLGMLGPRRCRPRGLCSAHTSRFSKLYFSTSANTPAPATSVISVSSVKKLREVTGSSMGECRRALVETGDDFQQALDWLKRRNVVAAKTRWEKNLESMSASGAAGASSTSTSSARSAESSTGKDTSLIALVATTRTSTPRNSGSATAEQASTCTSANTTKSKTPAANTEVQFTLVKVAAETDFVLRNHDFQQSALHCAELACSTDTDDKEKIRTELEQLSGRVGESCRLLQSVSLSGQYVFGYVHPLAAGEDLENCGRVGAIVSLEHNIVPGASSQVEDVGRKLCRHIAALQPRFLGRDDVPEDLVESERQIFRAQLSDRSLPEAAAKKAAEGKLGKWFEQEVLLDQVFLYDEKLTVGGYCKAKGVRIAAFRLLTA